MFQRWSRLLLETQNISSVLICDAAVFDSLIFYWDKPSISNREHAWKRSCWLPSAVSSPWGKRDTTPCGKMLESEQLLLKDLASRALLSKLTRFALKQLGFSSVCPKSSSDFLSWRSNLTLLLRVEWLPESKRWLTSLTIPQTSITVKFFC